MQNPKLKKLLSDITKKNWKNIECRNKMINSMKGRKSHRKGMTLEQEYGKEKANKIKEKIIKGNTGKKYSEEINKKKGRFGKDNAMSRLKVKEKQLNACRTYGKQWKGGISFEPYTKEFDSKLKKLIRKRDNYVCLKCGKHQEKEGKSLCVHHINYDKTLTVPQNCCSLCFKCHSEVNWNRKHWTKFFQSLLSEKYNYQYDDNQLIMQTIKEVSKGSW